METCATLRHEILYAWIMRVLFAWMPLDKFLATAKKMNPIKKVE